MLPCTLHVAVNQKTVRAGLCRLQDGAAHQSWCLSMHEGPPRSSTQLPQRVRSSRSATHASRDDVHAAHFIPGPLTVRPPRLPVPAPRWEYKGAEGTPSIPSDACRVTRATRGAPEPALQDIPSLRPHAAGGGRPQEVTGGGWRARARGTGTYSQGPSGPNNLNTYTIESVIPSTHGHLLDPTATHATRFQVWQCGSNMQPATAGEVPRYPCVSCHRFLSNIGRLPI